MVNAVKSLNEYRVLNEAYIDGDEEVSQPEFLIVHRQRQGILETQSIREFLNLSQFKTSGIVKKGVAANQLMSCMRSNQALQVSALVGKKVLVRKDTLFLGIEGAVLAAIEVPKEISSLTISFYNKFGSLMKQLSFSQPVAGYFQFNWDGTGQDNQRLSAGRYKIQAQGFCRGEAFYLRTLALANIDSVSLGKDGKGVKLSISGVGVVDLGG